MSRQTHVLLFALSVGLLMTATNASAYQSDKGEGGGPIGSPYKIDIGPVAGLTTAWHPSPANVAVPVGTVLMLDQFAPPEATVVWTNALEVMRDEDSSTAECAFTVTGVQIVVATVDLPNGQGYVSTLVFDVVDFNPADVTVGSIQATVAPLDLDENATNEETMEAYFGHSIASFTAVEHDKFLTSVDRDIILSTSIEPVAFVSLIEWRIDGVATTLLGPIASEDIDTVGTHTISVGPPASASTIEVETYSVTITSHQTLADIVPEGVPVTFEAVTEPAGYEQFITWVSSTKYGDAKPVVGQGPSFTVIFEDTFDQDPVNGFFQWLGVRADNDTFGQDQKTGGCCLSDGNCVDDTTESNCEDVLDGDYLGDLSVCVPGICPVCGDGVVNQPGEECDPPDDAACPGLCNPDCTCPPPALEACCFIAAACQDLLAVDCGGTPQGPGTSCAANDCSVPCPPDSQGGCCVGNGSTGCDDPACCQCVCDQDEFCCNVEWDILCAGEACDICSDDCACCDAPGPPNDNCANRINIFNGATPFSNVGATDDGPSPCGLLGSDIWYNYTAKCTGDLTVSLCGSGYDTVVAVYNGCGCPASEANLVACNDDSCGLQSEVTFPAVAGQCYKIQAGGFNGAQGDGIITITKDCPLDDCIPAGPDCFSTVCGATKADFGPDPIPADFFGPGSPPFSGTVQVRGEFHFQDTIILRLEEACFPPGLPSTANPIAIELVQLNLVSCAPVDVGTPLPWDMTLFLPGPQRLGQMTITKTHPNGGTFDSIFFVQPTFCFSQGGGPEICIDATVQTAMSATGSSWSTAELISHGDCSLGDGFVPGENQEGPPCCEEVCHGTDGDPAPCDPDDGHCHCAGPGKCNNPCPPGPAPIIDPGREEAERDVADPMPTSSPAPTTNPEPVAPSVGVDLGRASGSSDR